MTTIVKGGHLFDRDAEFRTGDIVIDNGVIISVESVANVAGADIIDARDRIVMPGLINAHTHSNQTLEKGLCDALPLDAWMVLASYGGAGARFSPRELYVSAVVGGIQMLRTGTTSVLDCARSDLAWLGEGLDAIAQAYVDLGMRAGVAAQCSDLNYFSSLPLHLLEDGAPEAAPQARPEEVLADVSAFADRWADRHPRITPMLGPSSLPRCSTDLFQASVDLARQRGLRMQTHLLSGRSQVSLAQSRYGGSTVAFLEHIGALQPWTSYAHAIWLDDEEVALFAASDAVAVHNPVSNLKLGAGVAPVPELLRAGAHVALGSDGASSNDGQNMWETLKMSTLVHRTGGSPESWLGAFDSLTMCWEGGARALGERIGRIEAGHRADLVLLRLGELFVAPKDQMTQQLVYGELGHSVDTVLVDGNVVVEDGAITTVDVDAIGDEAQAIVARVWRQLPQRHARYAEVAPVLNRLDNAVAAHELGFTRTR